MTGKAVSYYCSLALAYPGGALYAEDLTIGTIPDEIGKSKPGTKFVPVVTGPIPSGSSQYRHTVAPLGSTPATHY